MSVQALVALYINRIVTLINEKSTAKLEICCKAGEVNVNISHDLGVVEVPHIEQTPKKTVYNDMLKKNVNVSQFNKLQKRALARAEEAKVAMTAQQEITRNVQSNLAKATPETEKVEQEAEQAKAALLIIQSKANQAEQANERLMREKNWADKFKNEAEKAKLETTKAITDAEKAKNESDKAKKEAEKAANEILKIEQAKQECESQTKVNITKCIPRNLNLILK